MPTAIIGSRAGSIAHSVGNPTVKPSTERPTIWLAVGLDAGQGEHLAEVDAPPQGVADEIAADLVRDAGDRHVLLEDRHRGELAEREVDLSVDHPAHRQLTTSRR